jgi:5-dehydro-2-deoxygluconokinase
VAGVAPSDDAVLRAVTRLYSIGLKPEWWKLAPLRDTGWRALAELIAARDPQCRGAVILGLNQPLADLARGFAAATHPIVKGFMVGRTLWVDPARRWLRDECDDDAFVQRVAANFESLVDAWRASRPAAPVHPAAAIPAPAAHPA